MAHLIEGSASLFGLALLATAPNAQPTAPRPDTEQGVVNVPRFALPLSPYMSQPAKTDAVETMARDDPLVSMNNATLSAQIAQVRADMGLSTGSEPCATATRSSLARRSGAACPSSS
jgi:hypothetical protein